MDRLMVVRVGLKLQAVERDSLLADRDLSQIGPHLRIEAIPVHAEKARHIAQAHEPRW